LEIDQIKKIRNKTPTIKISIFGSKLGCLLIMFYFLQQRQKPHKKFDIYTKYNDI